MLKPIWRRLRTLPTEWKAVGLVAVIAAALTSVLTFGGGMQPATVPPQSGIAGPAGGGGNCENASVGLTPITELGSDRYRGEKGGLYPGGSNQTPPDHEQAGVELAEGIRPVDARGRPDADGAYGLISVGMSIAYQEFIHFKPLAEADPDKDPELVIVNGAQDGVTADRWADPADPAWDVLGSRVKQAGISDAQVAVAWVKMANGYPDGGWPADAKKLMVDTAEALRLLHARFPNLRLAYLTSRSYAGYATNPLNPEPYAYESGFAVKWLIEDQLEDDPLLNWDPTAGRVMAPWVGWGPYLWADGLEPRSDGVTWRCGDYVPDGTHPSGAGREKVARMLLDFFESDPTAAPWFTSR